MLSGEAVFVPNEVPRLGTLVLWGPGAGPDSIELVFPRGTDGVRKRVVPASRLPIPEALDRLLAIGPATAAGDTPHRGRMEPSHSVAVWAAAATAGIGLIARGRLLPTSTARGLDAWRVGPLDDADRDWLMQLARAFPPSAHALGIPGSRPMRVRSPQSLVRDFWDAIADSLVRTSAARRTVTAPAFASSEPTDVRGLGDWLTASADQPSAGARLGLRVEPVAPVRDDDAVDVDDPVEADGTDPTFRVVLQLRSVDDPSLIVDADDLWNKPEQVVAGFGAQAETDVLLALRRAATVWPPLVPALAQPRPTEVSLIDEEVSELLGPVSEELAGVGVEVLWPTSLLGDGLSLQAQLLPFPEDAGNAGFSLTALLDFRWQLTLDGDVLDADEIALLSEARRPLVRLRGRWVTVDRELLARLHRAPRAPLGMAEALGAVLAGSAVIDGETVTVVADGALAALADRLAGLAAAAPPVGTPSGLEATLRPYQQRGVAWMAGMCDAGFGGCLADDMGLGKTIQVIALHLHRREQAAGPTLVVCPASLLGTWARELARFAPGV
ncbi:MAG TPA: SNF2 helicase-associated domain-containing protein, partial [Kineosporiaceae bacterium]|nr:SNF2 helicase-associated domain-containing protein [Kineosporiaceae bacterium]